MLPRQGWIRKQEARGDAESVRGRRPRTPVMDEFLINVCVLLLIKLSLVPWISLCSMDYCVDYCSTYTPKSHTHNPKNKKELAKYIFFEQPRVPDWVSF